MIRRLFFAFGAVAIAAAAAVPSRAEEPVGAPAITESSTAGEPARESSNAVQSGEARDSGQADSAAAALPPAESKVENAAEPEPAQANVPAESAKPSPGEERTKATGSAAGQATETKPADEADAAPDKLDEEPDATPDMALHSAEPSPSSKPQEDLPPAVAPLEKAQDRDRDAEPASNEQPAATPVQQAPANAVEEPSPATHPVPAVVDSVEAHALLNALAVLPAGSSDEEKNERAALASFYESRGYAPLWLASPAGFNAKAAAIAGEIKRARDWGLDARDFPLPAGIGAASAATSLPEDRAAEEIKVSLAVLKYGRYARGGRIIDPPEQLSSYLDRRPQLLKPLAILDGIAAAEEPDAFLRGLNPKHPQFERLRQKYLALAGRNKAQSAEAKRLLANMEEWRWMPDDLGEVYVWNNIPEFTQRVMKDGKVVMKEAIVTGQISKETPIFSRPLRKITFKPTWIVPDSIKVREILPNLISGGGSLMRQWDLEVLKDGQPVNWHKIKWSETDIRTYEVIQPHGPKSVMGRAKFSFPSQHTVFMHDAAEGERWMFRSPKRTYSHGCMRVQNPVGLAEVLLREDKGWDAAKVKESLDKGGNNNEIPIEHRIMVHMTYFTALVDDDGKLTTFPDVYGHERRITLALEGKWNQIEKGRNHLAPVELNEANLHPRHHRNADENYYEQPPAQRRAYSYPNQGYTASAPAYAAPQPSPSYNYRSSFLESLFGSSQPQYPAAR